MPNEYNLHSTDSGTERRNVVNPGRHTLRKSILYAFTYSTFVRVLEQIHTLDSYHVNQSRGKAASPGTHAVDLNLGDCTCTSMVVRKEGRRTQ